jgi:lipopolysaccharide export system ATP-binding protein
VTSGPVLQAAALEVSYGRLRVLRGVDLTVGAGEVVAVLGPTGAGKTTLFRALVGERVADRGQVMLRGIDVTREPLWRRAKRGIGYIPQTPSVLPDLTVEGNLATFERLASKGKRGAGVWAAAVGLSHRLRHTAGDLSGGERRQLELARALIGAPAVVVCDEPFSGIDPVAARRVAELLRAKANQGLAIVMADHHASLALAMCDRAILLVDGEILRVGAPAELTADALVRERYLGEQDAGRLENGRGLR